MGRRGHDGVAAEVLDRLEDPSIVGGHDDAHDRRRRGGTPIDVLDHGTAGDVGQGLARKAARLVSRGDDGDSGDRNPERGRPGVRNRGHARYYHVTRRMRSACEAAFEAMIKCDTSEQPVKPIKKAMTSRRAAVYGVGAALLVTYLAAANMPSQEPPSRERAARPAAPAGAESLAVEVRSQAARLHARMAQAPIPGPNHRNPFSFGLAPSAGHTASNPMLSHAGMVHAAVAEDAVPPAPPLPALLLMGVAEETTAAGPRRTAVIGDGDTIYIVVEGQAVGSRYKVTRIGADAVELEDVLTHGYRRIAMR
jgi:hypothetical protein